MKCSHNSVQSAMKTRREADENPNSSVVAETMNLLENSSYVYKIMARSPHTVTKYLNGKKTHKAINNKIFERLVYINDQMFAVELVKSEIKQKEPITVGFFIPKYAQLRMLELYNIFFDKCCDVTKFEELEMDTDSLYLALSEHELYDCI